jgi:hypothetical protein
MPLRSLLRDFSIVALLPVLAAAQTPAPALIPLPREIKSIGAPVPLRTPIAIVAGRDSADRGAAEIFVSELAERGVAARVTGDGAWRVTLLRTGTAEASAVLTEAGLSFDAPMHDEGYVLITAANGARIVGATPAGIFYGLQTLAQLVGTSAGGPTVRAAVIRDWPAMRWRGVHDDLSRGPVPTLEYQKRQIRAAAAYKINMWSPYYEQSLQYDSHPLASPPGGAMSHADVRALVAYADQYHITLVPEQEAFGHLHHILKNEIYSGLGETPRGHVLAPGDAGSLPLIRDMFTEIAELFPGPFIHLGADETFELGRGRTKALVDSAGLGRVYLGFLSDVVATIRPVAPGRKFLFWGDVAGGSPGLVKTLPKDMIAVAWGYGATEIGDRGIKPFRDAGMETWVAPGVSSWNRVWPNFGTALANIRLSARTGQAGGSTGLLNTVWDDDGDAIFEETWYAILFGAAAAWQPGDSNIEQFQATFGSVFHGDTTGAIDAAHKSLMAAHAALQRTRAGDGNTQLFFLDPWAPGEDTTVKRLRPALAEARIRAESALVLIAKARKQTHLRELTALDAMELGARRIDWLAAKFQYSDMIATAFANAAADTVPAKQRQFLQDLTGMNGVFQDMRDGYSLTRDLFERAWRNENRPYWMTNALARFDVEIRRWVDRTVQFDQAMRRWGREGIRPRPEDIGMPARLVTAIRM